MKAPRPTSGKGLFLYLSYSDFYIKNTFVIFGLFNNLHNMFVYGAKQIGVQM